MLDSPKLDTSGNSRDDRQQLFVTKNLLLEQPPKDGCVFTCDSEAVKTLRSDRHLPVIISDQKFQVPKIRWRYSPTNPPPKIAENKVQETLHLRYLKFLVNVGKLRSPAKG